MTARIHIERMVHRRSIAVADESTPAYVLLKLIPTGLNGRASPPKLNLALALDVSGSMYEENGSGVSRLRRIQDAALNAIDKLRPDTTLAVVAFAHNARLLLPSTPLAEKGKIEDVLRRIDTFDVDPGGTALDEGLTLALDAVAPQASAGTLSQVVVLTDGETSGEGRCRDLARQAAARNIHLTLMGVGLDWKAGLIKDLAGLGQGKWYYIDVKQAQEATRVFTEEFENLAATCFTEVELRIRPVKGVRVQRLRQVVPEIQEAPLEEAGEGNMLARLGTLQQGGSRRYLLDVQLPRRPDGQYAVAQLELTYDAGLGGRTSSGPVPLEVCYTAAGHGPANGEVMKHIDEIEFKELNDNLEEALQKNNQQAARQVAEKMDRKAQVLGPAAVRKTMLARQAAEELNATGRLRRATQLALTDEARKADAGPA